MEQRFWIMFIVVALVLGLILGFGSGWKMRMAEVMELQGKVQQLTQENAGLRSRVASPVTPTAPPVGTTGEISPKPPSGSGEKK